MMLWWKFDKCTYYKLQKTVLWGYFEGHDLLFRNLDRTTLRSCHMTSDLDLLRLTMANLNRPLTYLHSYNSLL